MTKSSALTPWALVLGVAACGLTVPSTNTRGCPGPPYPEATTSPYAVPFEVGTTLDIGLANCSASYHAEGQPDQYATDFDLPTGTPFMAARAGVVSFVQEDQPSGGGGTSTLLIGNGVFVDHGDGTTGLYLHSPEDGITVEEGDTVQVGDTLGIVGRSGLAGYPHLHFIVVAEFSGYPYSGVPVSFRNASPLDVPLRSYTRYEVTPR